MTARCAIHPLGHKYVDEPDYDVAVCACGATMTGLEFALRESRRRIEAGCTEPGRAPVGAPYPHQPRGENVETQDRIAARSTEQLPPADGTCRSCGALIRWAVTASGRRMPVDAEPHEHGNVVLEVMSEPHPAKQTTLRALVIAPADVVADEVLRFRSHFATCPNARQHRSRR